MSDFDKEFQKVVPRLCGNPLIRREVWRSSRKEDNLALAKIDDGNETQKVIDELYEVVYEGYSHLAESILVLSWDGDGPSCSGASWIKGLDGVYMVYSSDYEPSGPYLALSDALDEDTFHRVTSSPEIVSKTLPKAELLNIAEDLVDEDGGSVYINGEEFIIKQA